MPPQQRKSPTTNRSARGTVCTALRSDGQRCKRLAVPGLTVCQSHGGGTAASVRAGKRSVASQQAAKLWGISTDAGSLSVEQELRQLARNKLTDITALRIKISNDDVRRHIGTLTETHTQTEYDIEGTVQSKTGTQETKTRRAGTSVWVQELHKSEMELVQILRLLQDVSGGTEQIDLKRIRMQSAMQAARLLKAFPGISVDEIVREVSKSA